MFGVASSLALLGLFVLLVPIILHMVNPGKGKLIWVGNIKLLQGAKKKRVNELRIENWLVLLLRLMMLSLLTLILARSYWQGPLKSLESSKVLVTPDWLSLADEAQKSALTDYQLLNDSFVWQQLAVLDKQAGATEVFEVYTTDALLTFDSPAKPFINRQINWHILPTQFAPRQSLDVKTLTVYGSDLPNSLVAALQAIKLTRMPGLEIHYKNTLEQNIEPRDWVIFAQAKPLPGVLRDMAAKGSTVLTMTEQTQAHPFGDGYIVPLALNDSPDFPNQLLAQLSYGQDNSIRFLNPTLRLSQIETHQGETTQKQQQTPLASYFWLLLILCWIAERYLVLKPEAKV